MTDGAFARRCDGYAAPGHLLVRTQGGAALAPRQLMRLCSLSEESLPRSVRQGVSASRCTESGSYVSARLEVQLRRALSVRKEAYPYHSQQTPQRLGRVA